MRKYETVFISDPDLQEKGRVELFDKVRNIISKEKGILLDFDEWGNKKLAYEIKKKFRGHYVCATYAGTGDLVKELERNMRLTDSILKFMTIVISDDVTVDQIEAEVKEAEEAEAAKAEAIKAASKPVEEVAEPAAKETEKDDASSPKKEVDEKPEEKAAEKVAETVEKSE